MRHAYLEPPYLERPNDLIGTKDFAGIEKKLLAAGHRFDWSAMISVRERPEAYKAATGVGEDLKNFRFEHDSREPPQRGGANEARRNEAGGAREGPEGAGDVSVGRSPNDRNLSA
jgi:hypothetical protein